MKTQKQIVMVSSLLLYSRLLVKKHISLCISTLISTARSRHNHIVSSGVEVAESRSAINSNYALGELHTCISGPNLSCF